MNAGGRLNTCKSDGNAPVAIPVATSGARVRNAYATYPEQGQNVEKSALISHVDDSGHPESFKGASWLWMGMRIISWLAG